MFPTAEVIRSRSNPLVKRFRALKESGSDDLAIIEGVKLLEEAVKEQIEIVEVACSMRIERNELGRELVETLFHRGIDVRMVDDGVLVSISEVETSQGVVALAKRPVFEEARLFQGVPLILVAVGIQNPGNMGALLRTADAAGATGVYSTDSSVDSYSWKALRGAMGSAFRLPHVSRVAATDVLTRLRERRVVVVAAANRSDAVPYDQVDFTQPTAILVGNESAGLSPETLAAANVQAVIPCAGHVESLNVGVAAGILLFEAARQRRVKLHP